MKTLVAATSGLALLLTLILPLMIAGCAGNLPESQRHTYLQENFSRSVKTINHNQTLNPAAGAYPIPVEGKDGRAADLAVEKHRETFSKEFRKDRGDFREQVIILRD